MAYFLIYNLNEVLPVAHESQAIRAAVLLGESGVSLTDTFLSDEQEMERLRKAPKREQLEIMIDEYRRQGNTEMLELMESYKLLRMFNSFFGRQHGFKKHLGLDEDWSQADYLEFLDNRMTGIRKYGMKALWDELSHTREFLVFYVSPQDPENKYDAYNSISLSLMEAQYEEIPCYHIMPECFIETVKNKELKTQPSFLFPDLLLLNPTELSKQTARERSAYQESLCS